MYCEYCNKNVIFEIKHSFTKKHKKNLIKGGGNLDEIKYIWELFDRANGFLVEKKEEE